MNAKQLPQLARQFRTPVAIGLSLGLFLSLFAGPERGNLTRIVYFGLGLLLLKFIFVVHKNYTYEKANIIYAAVIMILSIANIYVGMKLSILLMAIALWGVIGIIFGMLFMRKF